MAAFKSPLPLNDEIVERGIGRQSFQKWSLAHGTRTAAPSDRPARRSASVWLACLSG
jgi:hypothetical protein